MRQYYLIMGVMIFLVLPLFSDQQMVNDLDPFVIENVIYNASGRTKESAVRRRLRSHEQRGFQSQEELDKFIRWYKIELDNTKLFAAVSIDQSLIRVTDSQRFITLTVSIRDSLPVVPLPYVLFNSSTGLVFGLDLRLVNTGGYLFNTTFAGWVQFPNRDEGLVWSDPTWQGRVAFSDIQAGAARLMFNTQVTNNHTVISDRGEAAYTYHSLGMATMLGASYDIFSFLEFTGQLEASYTFSNSIIVLNNPNFNYKQPLLFSFIPSVGLYYNRAPFIDGAQRGNAAKVKISYILSAPVIDYQLDNDLKVEAKYGHYWQPSSFFFPQVVSEFYYRTGVPEFTMGRIISGIIDNQWRGNGALSVSSSFLFRLYNKQDSFQIQLGPMLNYGLVFEPHRSFDIADQGFTTGLKLILYVAALPTLPLSATLGFDLRKRHDQPRFGQRIELIMKSSFSF